MSILEARGISKVFADNGYEALKDVSLTLEEGQSLGIVGESGSGKSTLALVLGGLLDPTEGSVLYRGRDIRSFTRSERKTFRTSVQYIFQDPKAAMNPFFTLRRVLEEPLRINRKDLSAEQRTRLIEDHVTRLGLDCDILSRHPDEVSGGQAQRIVIARALLLEPEIIVADECVSALDTSVQAQIINILRRVRTKTGASFIFISHDIDLVRYFCDRVHVMLHGRMVETLDADRLDQDAKSDYTKLLLGDSL